MILHVLPTRVAGAAENMAVDFLMLQRYPQPEVPRFRHYGWRNPAVTFGYSQKIAWVRAQLSDPGVDLSRRPTGGGIVRHDDDWTYALVIPRGHRAEEERAAASYRAVHGALAEALAEQGVPTRLQTPEQALAAESSGDAAPSGGLAAMCFERAEAFDVVHGETGRKIAGAAQKRNKHGLLFQGSVSRAAPGAGAVDWDRFGAAFVTRVANVLGATAEATPWPDFDPEEYEGLTERYASAEWIGYR